MAGKVAGGEEKKGRSVNSKRGIIRSFEVKWFKTLTSRRRRGIFVYSHALPEFSEEHQNETQPKKKNRNRNRNRNEGGTLDLAASDASTNPPLTEVAPPPPLLQVRGVVGLALAAESEAWRGRMGLERG